MQLQLHVVITIRVLSHSKGMENESKSYVLCLYLQRDTLQ